MDYSILSKCRACACEMRHENNVEYSFGHVPLAGNFCKSHKQAIDAGRYPLTLVCCENCQAVQVLHDVDDRLLFSEYNYSSSTVGGLNRHFETYAKYLSKHYADAKTIAILEIGCNDGVLLKKLPSSWSKIGVDPSDIAKLSCDETYRLFNEPFTKEMVEEKGLVESCDVVSGSNCLAHISDIKNVFEGVWLALKTGGDFFIEVHDLYATIKSNQWDTLYHEHKIEWDIESLKNALLPLGFKFGEAIFLPLHGGLIRARFVKTMQKESSMLRNPNKLQMLDQLHAAYTDRYNSDEIRLLQKQPKEKIVAYGASGRAVMFLNQFSDLQFEYVVDDSPVRIGKFIPSIGTSILSSSIFSEREFDYCLVTAWNYFDDIKKNNPIHKGKWLKYFDSI